MRRAMRRRSAAQRPRRFSTRFYAPEAPPTRVIPHPRKAGMIRNRYLTHSIIGHAQRENGMPAASLAPHRIDYLPMIDRPIIRWPNGARVAFWVAPNIEHYEYLPPLDGVRN